MSYVCVSFRTYCTSRNHMSERYQMQWLCHFVILIQTISRRPSVLLRAFLLSTRIRNVVIVYDGSKLDSGGGKVCCLRGRSTQPCIPPGSLNRVPASAGVRAGMSPLPGGR